MLKNRIIKEEEENAKQILEDASLKAQKKLEESKKIAEDLIKKALTKAKEDGAARKEAIISRARMDARNAVLLAKQACIDKVFEMVWDRIYNMERDEYTTFIEKLLLNNIEYGDEEVIFADRDKTRIDPGTVAKINDILISQNKKGALRLSSESRNIKSGFLLKCGNVEVNCTIESQLKVLRERMEGEIGRILFQNS